LRSALAIALGIGLAALPVALVAGILKETVRGSGFSREVALGNEIHPAALLQVVVSGLFGSLSDPVDHWWGGRFFTKGFPYFLSLYLGPLALCLAATATGREKRLRSVLLLLASLALVYGLGARGGLAPLLASVPGLRSVRFPSKAFLIPHLVVALLAAFGVDSLRAGAGWRRFATVAAAIGAGLIALVACLLASGGGGLVQWDVAVQRAVTGECLVAALLCLLGVGLAVAVLGGRLSPQLGLGLTVMLLVADLARAGQGMNPQVSPAFFRPLPEMAAERLDALGGGRVFTYGVDHSPAFLRFLAAPAPGRGLWSFFVSRQVLAPYANMLDGVEAAEAKDLTSFVPWPLALAPEDYAPAAVATILTRLRDAAVTRVVSLDPLDHVDLRLRAVVAAGPPDLSIHVYELRDSWPRAYVACRVMSPDTAGFDGSKDVALDAPAAVAACSSGSAKVVSSTPQESAYQVEVRDGPGVFVARDSFARGWLAWIDGQPSPVLKANGRHRAVWVGPGRHEIVFRYRPPGLRQGLVATLLAAVATAALWLRPGLRQ
jgi:hypothetical protein